MKPIVSPLLLLRVLAAMSVASFAFAQQGEHAGGREYRERAEGMRGLRGLDSARHGATAQEFQSVRADEAMPPRPQARERMSLEERRQLRRDIHEAGRDLYRLRPGHGGHP